MKKPTTPPQIELLKVSDLEVEKGFNPREHFKENVKELKPQIEARGFIDPSTHVVQFIERDGKKVVRGGHTLLQAAKELGIKEIPACKTELDPIAEQVNLITSNSGKSLTKYEQGTVYVRLRDGQLRDGVEWDENGKVKDGKKVRDHDPAKDFYRKPMNGQEIADAVGFTREHISQCMIIRESDAEIGQKLIDGKITANGVLTAVRGVNSVDKQLRIINAAIAAAKEEGKETASDKHVRAVKEQFIEKKQVAAPVTTTTETTSANRDTVKETKTSRPKGEPQEPEAPAPELFNESDEPPTDEIQPDPLTPEMRALFDGRTPEGKEDQVRRFIALITTFIDLPETAGALSAESIETLAVAIVKTLETPI